VVIIDFCVFSIETSLFLQISYPFLKNVTISWIPLAQIKVHLICELLCGYYRLLCVFYWTEPAPSKVVSFFKKCSYFQNSFRPNQCELSYGYYWLLCVFYWTEPAPSKLVSFFFKCSYFLNLFSSNQSAFNLWIALWLLSIAVCFLSNRACSLKTHIFF